MDSPVLKALMPMWSVCACGLPMSGRCKWAYNFGPVTFDLGNMTLTLYVSGDGSTPCGHDLGLEILVDSAVSMVSMPT